MNVKDRCSRARIADINVVAVVFDRKAGARLGSHRHAF